MSWTLCTSGAAIIKAGTGASTTIVGSGAALAEMSDEVEAFICDALRVDVVTNYGSLTSNGKKLLGRLAASMIAQDMVDYDTTGYNSAREAELKLDKLENDISKALKLLEDDKVKAYLQAT